MESKVKRYFQLKQMQKEVEQELGELRNEIMSYCREQGVNDFEIGRYRVKVTNQERKDYDDNQLYHALPDPEVWRMISKADAAKISSLLKLNVISDETLKGTYSIKHISSLQVEKE